MRSGKLRILPRHFGKDVTQLRDLRAGQKNKNNLSVYKENRKSHPYSLRRPVLKNLFPRSIPQISRTLLLEYRTMTMSLHFRILEIIRPEVEVAPTLLTSSAVAPVVR